MKRISDERSETVSYRLPASALAQAQAEAGRRGVRVSVVLREATLRGMGLQTARAD
jgi:hypothetical protein